MRKRSLVKLNLILAVVFLVFLVIILITVNPFKVGIFIFILFYLILFGFVLSLLNLLKIPWWLRILIAISIIFIILIQGCRV